jgi:nicotinamidase-related amidase
LITNSAQILSIPIFATTQLREKLGSTDPDLNLDSYNPKVHADKALFSMWTPEVRKAIEATYPGEQIEAVIVGIESHICVTQTTLDLLRDGHKVYVLADGVSSCNPEEVPIALARLRAEGAIVTTSESWIYECMKDASLTEFKAIAGLVKDTKEDTKSTMQSLCRI